MRDRSALDVGPGMEDVVVARRFVTDAVEGWGIDSSVVALVTSELVTNALEHAGHGVNVAVAHNRRCLRVEVSNHSAILPVIRELDSGSPAGRGMVIVQQLTSDWGAISHPGGGKTVWVEFDLPAVDGARDAVL